MSPALDRWFREYAADHRHPMNRLTHTFAIPLIVFHVLAMLSWIPLFTVGGWQIDAAVVGGLAALAWYVRLHAPLALMMALVCTPMLWIADWTPRWAVVAIAVAAWTIQLAGHYVWERNRPSFGKNVLHTLIGPFFFLAVTLRMWPQREPAAA